MNLLYRCAIGALFGFFAGNAMREGHYLFGAVLAGFGVVAASWTDGLSAWVMERLTRPSKTSEVLATQTEALKEMAGHYVSLIRVHREMVVGMTELRDLIAEVPMTDHTRRVLMASIFNTGERIHALMEDADAPQD